MKAARDSGSHRASPGHLLLWVPALALFSMLSGCVGWSSVGDNRTGLSGAFWNHSDKVTKTPAYDLYADTGTVARPQAGDDAQLASGNAKARRKNATTEEPTPDLVAQKDATRSPDAAGRRMRARTGDTSIRVTLGRPESLPTLTDPADAGGPMMASADATKWKRGDSAVASETAPQPGKSRSRDSRGAERNG